MLEAFVKETLRCMSPVPFLIKREALCDHYIGDIFIKKGTFVDVNLFGVMKSNHHWEKPEEFFP